MATSLVASLNTAIARLGTFRTSASGAATAAKSLGTASLTAEKETGRLATGAGRTGGLLGIFKKGSEAATTGMKGLNAAMKANLIGLLLQLLAPLIQKFVDLVTHSKLVQAVVQKAFAVVGQVVGAVSAAVKSVIEAVWPYISTLIRTVVTVIATVVKTYFAIIRAEIETVMTVAKVIVTAAWDAIRTVFTTTLGVIKGAVSGAWNLISGIFTGTLNTIKASVDSVWTGIKDTITGVIHTVSDTMSSVWGGLSTIAKGAFDMVASVVRTPINAVIGLVNTCIDGLNSIHVSIPSWIPGIGGSSFGISLPHIPTLAEGGIVLPRPGGTLALIGEAGQSEAVLPLAKLGALLTAQRGPQLATTGGGTGRGLTVTNYYEAEHGSARRTAEELMFLAKARG